MGVRAENRRLRGVPILRTAARSGKTPPVEFDELRQVALGLGIAHVESGPLVRSSYHADGQAALIRDLRAARP